MRRFLKKFPWLRSMVTAVTALWLAIATGPCLAALTDCPVMPKPCHSQSDIDAVSMPDCPMLTASDALPGDAFLNLHSTVQLPVPAMPHEQPVAEDANTHAPPPTAFVPAPPPHVPLFLTHLALLR